MIIIKEKLKTLLDLILYFYNLGVTLLVKLEDKQRRDAQFKKENPVPKSFGSRVSDFNNIITYYLTPKRFTLNEQKDLMEMLKMSIKFSNAIKQPFEFMAQRKDLRLFVRIQCKKIADELSYKPLHESLEGKNVLSEEYVTLIEVAQRTGDYIPTYESIIESIVDKKKRRNTFLIIMIQPFLTLFTAVGIETYVALTIVPDLTVNIPLEEAPATIMSYIQLREILLFHKLEYAIKIGVVVVGLYFFMKIPATKYLMNLLLMQIPGISNLVAQWEVSKFFNSVNAMIKSGSSMQEATKTALGLLSNKIIRASMTKDLMHLGEKTNDLSEILGESVYIDLKIRNQLKIAKVSGSDSSDILESVVEEYKDSMKKLLEAPASFVIPIMLGAGGIYLFTRLMPLFNEINTYMQNIGS